VLKVFDAARECRWALAQQPRELEEQIREERLSDGEYARRHMAEGRREQTGVAYALLCRGE
jgi:hypothetical protein